jgi:hypothetical protein
MMLDWVLDHFGLVLSAAVIVGLIGLGVAFYYGQKEWEAYAAKHHCVAIGEKEASNALSSDGKIVFIPGQTIYRCDGGEEIIR